MKKTVSKRIRNLIKTNVQHFFSSYSIQNWKQWKEIKGKYHGKRIFLVANGPSLNITPLYLLKDEYVIVFNRFQLMLERVNYMPTFYMIADGVVGNDIRSDIKFFIDNCQKVFVPDISKGDSVDFTKFLPFRDNLLWMYEEPIRFSHSLPFVSPGHTVIFRAFQVLKYLGFDEVIVVGNDMNYVIHTTTETIKEETTKGKTNQTIRSKYDDDPNHFDPRYFGKGKVYHQPTSNVVERMFENLQVVAEEYTKHGVNVVNAGYNSKVECFEKIDFYKVLDYSQDRIDELFDDLVKSRGLESRKWLFEKAIVLNNDWDGYFEVVAVPVEFATDVVKKKVLEYLPIGPYNEKIYFINRSLLPNNK